MTEQEAQDYLDNNPVRAIYLSATKENLKPEGSKVMIVGKGKNISRGENLVKAVENFIDLETIEAKKNSLRQRMVSAQLIF